MRGSYRSALIALALVGCTNRAAFKIITYPPTVSPTPEPDHRLALSLVALDALNADFKDPVPATRCIEQTVQSWVTEWDDGKGTPPPLADATVVYERSLAIQDLVPQKAPDARPPFLDAFRAACPPGTLADVDRVRAADALWSASYRAQHWIESAGMSSAVELSGAHETTASNTIRKADRRLYLGALLDAAQGASALAKVAGRSDSGLPSNADLPALALSGGAANGAFTAGFLYELLQARERALVDASPAEQLQIHRTARFGTIASTSVGTLLGLPLDLYFALDAGPAPLPDRSGPQHQVDTLRTRFIAEEGDVLCPREGSALAALRPGGHPKHGMNSLLRFQPIRTLLRAPDALSMPAMDVTRAGPLRIPMTVDIGSGLLLAADERACASAPDPHTCLEDGMVASIVEPVFAEPISAPLYAGLLDPRTGGPRPIWGAWIDGGLRSGTPAEAAMAHTHRTVLAVSTHWEEGGGDLPAATVADAAFRSVGLFTNQMREWELRAAEAEALNRQSRRARLAADLGVPGNWTEETPIRSVHVPEDAPAALAAAGYSFDPAVMILLFRWGQRAFLTQRDDVLGELGEGWASVSAAPGMQRWYLTEEALVDADIDARDNAVSDPVARIAHVRSRKKSLHGRFPTCPSSADAPMPDAAEHLAHDPTFAPELSR